MLCLHKNQWQFETLTSIIIKKKVQTEVDAKKQQKWKNVTV